MGVHTPKSRGKGLLLSVLISGCFCAKLELLLLINQPIMYLPLLPRSSSSSSLPSFCCYSSPTTTTTTVTIPRSCESPANSTISSITEPEPETLPAPQQEQQRQQQQNDKLTAGLYHNKSSWAAHYREQYSDLASGQSPEILWIGCSDSRCPETAILGLQPGDVFVHRNIANMIHYSDLNSACVIEYAVEHLKVKHIVVCGHTACGGVRAALGNTALGILDAWLLPLRKLRQQHLKELEGMDEGEKVTRLAELNVRDGVGRLLENSAVIEAMESRGLKVHGLIYDVASGVLRTLEFEGNDGEGEEEHERIKARLTAFRTKRA